MKELDFDNINRILKTLSPKIYKYSKISKLLDREYKYISLEHLLKSLELKCYPKDPFEPDHVVVLHKNDYNINFQNSYDYLDVYSDINNLPVAIKNKNCIKDGVFNPDYEYDLDRRNMDAKYCLEREYKRKKEKLKRRFDSIRRIQENKSSFLGLHLHPNYNAIKRRIPSVVIRNPNVHIKDSWLVNCPFRNTFEIYKQQENEKKENMKKINKSANDIDIEKIQNINNNSNNNISNNNNTNNNNTNINNSNINNANINNSNINNLNFIINNQNISNNNYFLYNPNENNESSQRTIISYNDDINQKRDEFLLMNERKYNIRNKYASKIVKKIKNDSLPFIPYTPQKPNNSFRLIQKKKK